MTEKRFQIDDDGDISEFDSNGKWVDCWMYANGKHWESLCDELNHLNDENEQLKQELFETSKELLWATSDEVDRALHYKDEVEELRKEIFE